MASEFDEFSESLSCKVGEFDPSVIRDLEYTHLLIRMGDKKPSEEFRRLYPTIRTIVFEVYGRRYEYDADQFLALLDWFKDYGYALADARAEREDA